MSARIFNCLLVMLVLSATRTALADGPSSGQDLQATIVLNGQPCDQVVGVKRNADSDYVAICKDGNRYRVFVNPQGRVVVQKI
ncbi:MAG TPA: hypothetical protein VK743_21535 [Steroidobacteraceae bacterium]|nr:hypothetical protein [Steroidobacteraceae bacterium]